MRWRYVALFMIGCLLGLLVSCFIPGCASTPAGKAAPAKPYVPPKYDPRTVPENNASWPEWFYDRVRERNLQPKARP